MKINSEQLKGKIDFGIITIREDEFDAVLKRFPSIATIEGRRLYSLSKLKTLDGSEFTIASVRCVEQGTGEGQSVARDLIEDLDPQWILVVGIAGGVPSDEFTLGDVIAAIRMHDFTVSANLDGGVEKFAVMGGPMHRAVQDLLAHLPAMVSYCRDWNTETSIGQKQPPVKLSSSNFYGDDEWRKSARKSIIRHFKEKPRLPILVTGTIASSDRLVKDSETVKQWQDSARQLLAVEMELAGVYRAARQKDKEYPVLAVRGISDIVGFKRDPDWTAYACNSAAACLQAILKTTPIKPINSDINSLFNFEDLQNDGANDSKSESEVKKNVSKGKRLINYFARPLQASLAGLILMSILIVASIFLQYYKKTLSNPAEITYKNFITQEFGYIPLFGKNTALQMDKSYVVPTLINHKSLQTLTAERDIQNMLGFSDTGSLKPIWTFEYGELGRDFFQASIPLTVRNEGPVSENSTNFEIESVENLLKKGRHIVILGKPGLGKTTLLRYLCFRIANAQTESIPVFISGNSIDEKKDIKTVILDQFSTRNWALSESELNNLLNQGRLHLFVDGLELTKSIETQGSIENSILALSSQYPQISVLVSYRNSGYHGRMSGYDLVEVRGFNEDQQNQFITNYFDDENKSNEFKEGLSSTPGLRRLGSIPLLLSLMCLIKEETGKLPSDLIDLHRQSVELLLKKWELQKGSLPDYVLDFNKMIDLLGFIAFDMHSRRTASIREDEILALIHQFSQETSAVSDQILQNLILQGGLLSKDSREHFSFIHLSFQEYFAARHLSNKPQLATFNELASKSSDPWWEELIFFYAGFVKEPFLKYLFEQKDDIFFTKRYLVDQIIRRGLASDPKVVEQITAFHLKMIHSDLALNRYRSFSAFSDWLSKKKVDPITKQLLQESKQKIEYILYPLCDIDPNIRLKAARHIANFANISYKIYTEGEKQEDDKKRLQEFIKFFLNSCKRIDVKVEILSESLDFPDHQEMLTKLLNSDLKQDHMAALRKRAYESLSRKPDLVDQLIESLLGESNKENREFLAKYLKDGIESGGGISEVLKDESELNFNVISFSRIIKLPLPEEYLKRALLSENKEIRLAAIKNVREFKLTNFVDALNNIVKRTDDPIEISEAAETLTDLSYPLSNEQLINMLRSDVEQKRASAAYALRSYNSEETRNALRSSLTDNSATVRNIACQSLTFLKDAETVPKLIEFLQAQNTPRGEDLIYITSIAEIGGTRAREFLKEYAKNAPYPNSLVAFLALPEEEISQDVVDVLLSKGKNVVRSFLSTKIKDSKIKTGLIKQLSQSKDPFERMSAALECINLNNTDIKKILLGLLKDKHLKVRDAAYTSLYILSRQPVELLVSDKIR